MTADGDPKRGIRGIISTPEEEIRRTVGDHVTALCALLAVPDPTKTIRVSIAADGIAIEYSDVLPSSERITRTVHHRGPIIFRQDEATTVPKPGYVEHFAGDEGPLSTDGVPSWAEKMLTPKRLADLGFTLEDVELAKQQFQAYGTPVTPWSLRDVHEARQAFEARDEEPDQ